MNEKYLEMTYEFGYFRNLLHDQLACAVATWELIRNDKSTRNFKVTVNL